MTTTRGFRVLSVVATVAAGAAAAAVPALLSPSQDVLYATSVAFAIGVLAIAVAWMFAGDIPLGHWGLAGFGAAVAVITPGPWPLRCLFAAVAIAVVGTLFAVASRGRAGLSFAVLGLAAAVAAPVVVLQLGRGALGARPGIVGAVAGVVAVLAAVAVVRLRSSANGVRMVAVRDEPERAPWLGANAGRTRTLALGLSGLLAGLAGALYIAATPAGIAPGAFNSERSLDLLAMGVVGGLGSPVGVLLGAGALWAARFTLPGAWAMLTSGVGVLVVVLFFPAGLGRLVEWVRDLAVRLVVRQPLPEAPSLEPAAIAAPVTVVTSVRGHIAGSDTREAWSTTTVRAAAGATFATASIGWAAAAGTPRAWDTWLGLPGGAGPWLAIATIGASIAAAVVAWRGDVTVAGRAGPATTVAIALLAAYVALTSDLVTAALLLPVVAIACGWVVGRAARLGAAACVADVVPAAGGIVTAFALGGTLGAIHLLMVAGGGGFGRAAFWSIAYGFAATAGLVRTGRRLVRDRRRTAGRAIVELVADEAAAATAGLAVDGLALSFGATEVIRSATLRVPGGELVALVGGNGAGKSTLLRAVAGFIVPDAGSVTVAGEDVTRLRPEERAAAGLAFVSGARPVFPDLTVVENLRVAAFSSHANGHSFEEATSAVLDLVPTLRDRRSTRAGVLSGGEQRLLAVAQTLYRMPTVLLADELSLGLDVGAREAVLDLLRLLADQGVAIVAVDHDLVELLARCDRAALISEGTVQDFPDPQELLARRADLLPATFLAAAAS